MIDVIVTRPFMNPAEFGIYAFAYMQVCAYCEVPPETVEQRANALNPPGESYSWRIEWGKDEEHRDLSPLQCRDDPARIHYMLSC